MTMISSSTLVVVADGGTARFFSWPKRGEPLAERDGMRMEVSPFEGDRGPSPRVQDSFGGQRHRVERRLSAREAHEQRFLADVAARILKLMEESSAQSILLCAPPRALGHLRKAVLSAGRGYEILALGKDLTKESVRRVETRISELRTPE
jgi:protein required for attachment to host cells